jgi:hypothetical protein
MTPIMTNTRYDPEKKFKKASGDILAPANVTTPTASTNYVQYLPYALGALVLGVVIWKLAKKK